MDHILIPRVRRFTIATVSLVIASVSLVIATVNYLYISRFLKACLQYMENLRTFSATSRNKWTECVDLTLRFLPKMAAAVKDGVVQPT